jgi:hypothetical protein
MGPKNSEAALAGAAKRDDTAEQLQPDYTAGCA